MNEMSPKFSFKFNLPLVWHVYFAVLGKDHSCKVLHLSMSVKKQLNT